MANFGICGTNSYIIDNPDINLTYDNILAMDDTQFLEYITRMRAAIRDAWNDHEMAPAAGWTEDRVRDDFGELSSFPVKEFWRTDELSGRRCIHNTHTLGNAINGWNLSRMLKTRINYTEKDEGRSIYDFFAKDELFKKYLPYARRHFLRDSFFFFAQTVKVGDSLPHRNELKPQTALEWVTLFNEHEAKYGTHALLIDPRPQGQKDDYTGYAEHLRNATFLAFTWQEFKEHVPHLFRGCSGMRALRLLQAKHLSDKYEFHIRMYEKGQRLFPAMFKSFRVSMCQYAVNFPPLTAKLLYETFLPNTRDVTIWDPSAGWGGRILGAMSTDRRIDGEIQQVHYIGTDPNPAFYKDDTSVYASIGDFYNSLRSKQSLFGECHTYKVYQSGSEEIKNRNSFRQYRGKLDLVFSSPPYFNREAYSEDGKQSYKKYPAYDSWRDGFLYDTLQTAYEWLRHERYLLWNIADLKVGKKYLPLEQDSMRICKDLGFEYRETILMTLRSMPGANRVMDGEATAKNFCKVDGRILKYEPVHVFWKP